MELVVGTKAWSSWSLRPWLVLRRANLPFTETVVELRRSEQSTAETLRHSPSGRVPVLKFEPEEGGGAVWDSLAICEYVADRYPEAALWPADPVRRAVARSATAEMHSGFASLRNECPMDLKLSTRIELSEPTAADVRRIVALWRGLREEAAADGVGPYLFGDWTIADAFYTPVATRFRSYGVDLAAYGDVDGTAQAYADALLATPEFLEWEAAA
jgi:glutathione S-transferase